MEFKIRYKNSVSRDLKRIGLAEARRIVDKIDFELIKNADSYPTLKGKFSGLRKYRIGDYRVIYSLIDDIVLILRIRNRRDVYE